MAEVEEPEPRPDLVWDDQVCGLCVRVYSNGSQSFLFVYRINDHQRFIKIGKSPVWSLEAARKRATKLRAVVDEGDDPARELNRIDPVENVMRHIAEHRDE
jgi:hypothetical protein